MARRKSDTFARTYHSAERAEWISAHPCIACGKLPTENSHIRGGGMGRKGDYRFIVPKCKGHHQEYHRIGAKSFEAKYGVDLLILAALYQEAWEKHQARLDNILGGR